METEQKEIQVMEAETGQPEAPQAEQRVGALLKGERERLGLSREQITEMTRMRTQVVEAIENEAWGSLPPSVFVRGFLRSYAKVLGVSQDAVIDLYAKSAPPDSPGLKPSVEPSESHRPRARIALLILVLLAVAYGMWHFYPSLQIRQGDRDTEKRNHEAALKSAPAEKRKNSVPSKPAVIPDQQPVRPAEEPVKKEPGPEQIINRETPSDTQRAESPARDPIENEEGWLSLTGTVKERTWLRIKIDGKEEKEYLLQPGSRLQWKGKESFYMLIGNAAGIDFELNGKKVENLGKPGQVVRVTLPRDVGHRERDN